MTRSSPVGCITSRPSRPPRCSVRSARGSGGAGRQRRGLCKPSLHGSCSAPPVHGCSGSGADLACWTSGYMSSRLRYSARCGTPDAAGVSAALDGNELWSVNLIWNELWSVNRGPRSVNPGLRCRSAWR